MRNDVCKHGLTYLNWSEGEKLRCLTFWTKERNWQFVSYPIIEKRACVIFYLLKMICHFTLLKFDDVNFDSISPRYAVCRLVGSPKINRTVIFIYIFSTPFLLAFYYVGVVNRNQSCKKPNTYLKMSGELEWCGERVWQVDLNR